MACTFEDTCRRLVKKLKGPTKFVYALNKDYRRVDGRIKSGHYARRVVEGELVPERDRLRIEIDEEKAYTEQDALQIVNQYRVRSHDHKGADDLEDSVREYVREHMGNGYALGILDEFFVTKES